MSTIEILQVKVKVAKEKCENSEGILHHLENVISYNKLLHDKLKVVDHVHKYTKHMLNYVGGYRK